jgi:hypothetical protein
VVVPPKAGVVFGAAVLAVPDRAPSMVLATTGSEMDVRSAMRGVGWPVSRGVAWRRRACGVALGGVSLLGVVASSASALSFSQSAGSPFAVGAGPNTIVAGDFNGDGKLDLATANTSGQSVSVLLGDGAGGFVQAPGSPVSLGTGPYALATGDFDGDGNLDLAIAEPYAGYVVVLLGDGSGRFHEASGSPFAAGKNPDAIAVGDFNGDGKADLAVANYSDNTVSVLLGDGHGGFNPAPGSPITVGTGPLQVAAVDLNTDGKLDLAVVNTQSGNMSVLLGDGAGGFHAASGSPVPVGSYPASIAFADFNHDGKLDLAVVRGSPATQASTLVGDGAGGFSSTRATPVTSPTHVTAGNFTGDGNVDLAFTDYGGNVQVALGDGTGGFTAGGSPFAVGNGPFDLALGDFNRDGKLDIAVANRNDDNVSVLLNTTAPPPGTSGPAPLPGQPTGAGEPRPVISHPSLTHKRFRVSADNTAVSAAAPRGTSFRFTLSVAARVNIAITHIVGGVLSGNRCITGQRADATRSQPHRCRRSILVATLTRANEPSGADSIRFSGRIGQRALKPGSYRATLTAVDPAGQSGPDTLAFEVVR